MTTYKEKALEHVRSVCPELQKDPIKHMVGRFLGWRLPHDFHPDGGITFKADFNEHTEHPMKHEPIGTNLLDAEQAKEMFRFAIEDDGGNQIIGHTPHLEHWVRVLGSAYLIDGRGNLFKWLPGAPETYTKIARFDLTTGQPATEADYQAYCEIVGV